MRSVASSLLCSVTLGLGSSVVHAQQAFSEAPFHWHVLGGYSVPVGATSESLQGGYAVGGGFSVTPVPGSPIDLRVDLGYSDHQATQALINAGAQAIDQEVDDGHVSIWSLTGNAVYYLPFFYGVRGYGIAGVGAYHARVALTQYGGYGGYYGCDPFYGYCGEGLVAEDSVTKFGWNAGLGVEFALPYRQSWFIEARYNRIQNNGAGTGTAFEYIPITVGYRF